MQGDASLPVWEIRAQVTQPSKSRRANIRALIRPSLIQVNYINYANYICPLG